jgi:hypothetical protein
MMNNTFHMQRFIWLFNKHTKEHYKTYLMSLAVLVGVMAITIGYTGYMGGLSKEVQQVLFVFFLVFSGCIFSSMIFSDLGHKKKALSLLTLPVSSFERFLVSWIYSFVIFQVVFIACFYMVDAAVIKIVNSYAEFPKTVIDISANDNGFHVIFLYFWFLHGTTFLGSIYFKKLHFVKTALVVFGFVFILILLNQAFVRLIIDRGVSAKIPFAVLRIHDMGAIYYVESLASLPVILTFMLSVSVLCLWAATYFKLKEKQV